MRLERFKARCHCGREAPWLSGHIAFDQRENPASAVWECSACPDRPYTYTVPAADLFKGKWDTLDWLAHLAEKEWFDPAQFFKLIESLRDESRA